MVNLVKFDVFGSSNESDWLRGCLRLSCHYLSNYFVLRVAWKTVSKLYLGSGVRIDYYFNHCLIPSSWFPRPHRLLLDTQGPIHFDFIII